MRPFARVGPFAVAALLASSVGVRAGFVLGDASQYALLFQGGAGNTLQITNVTTNTTGGGTGVAAGQGGGIGNIGVGHTGKVSLSGPGTISGNLDIAAANNGQVTGGGVTIKGSTSFGVGLVASALNTVNALNVTLGALPGAHVAVNGNTTIHASAGMFSGSGAGYTNVLVFDVSSFSLNNGQTLTINGDGLGDAVVLNFTSSTNFHGNVVLTGGLTPDDVLFNFVGGSGLTGGPTLDINNGGGSPSNGSYLSQGIFLDPNGPISVVNSNVLGRVFGGDSHDFQYVSGSNITAPTPGTAVPAPSTVALALAGAVPLGLLAVLRRRGRAAPTLPA
jgi:hypothetical protein